jgi:L-iditol 2-dehydrogenase
MNTRVAELAGIRDFRLTEATLPDPGPGEVQVRVEAVGVCGSDLHSYQEGAVGDTPARFPMVIGHEPAGSIVKTGPGVSGWSAGDRAAFEPAIYCYHCEFCMSGHHNVCAEIRFLSTPGNPGFFRDYANIPAGNLIPIPADMSAPHATLIEPLGVVLHSMKLVNLSIGETAAVFGAGPIGLMTAICLRLAGAGRIYVIEPVRQRREMAAELAKAVTIDKSDPVGHVMRETRGRGVDVAIDCATKENTINQAINVVRNAGRVVVTGIPSGVLTPIEFSPMRRKEVALLNVRRANHDEHTAAGLLASHLNLFAPMVTHSRPLEEVGAAFAQVEAYEGGVQKMMILP